MRPHAGLRARIPGRGDRPHALHEGLRDGWQGERTPADRAQRQRRRLGRGGVPQPCVAANESAPMRDGRPDAVKPAPLVGRTRRREG